jgi:hypothetical protein
LDAPVVGTDVPDESEIRDEEESGEKLCASHGFEARCGPSQRRVAFVAAGVTSTVRQR